MHRISAFRPISDNKKIANYFKFPYIGRNYSSLSFHNADPSPPLRNFDSTSRRLTEQHSTDEEDFDDDVQDEEDVDVEQCSDTEENKDGNVPPRKKVEQTNIHAINFSFNLY